MGAAEKLTTESFTTVKFRTLRAQLALYGLNPSEWNIVTIRESSNSYELEYRQDPSFRMNARVRSLRSGQLRVERLSVISI